MGDIVFLDRAKENSSTVGTGPVALGGATSGCVVLSGIGNGNTTYYTIEEGITFEVGKGTYDSSANTLSRDTVFSSSNSDDSKVNLVGNSTIFVTLPANIMSPIRSGADGNFDSITFGSGVDLTIGGGASANTQSIYIGHLGGAYKSFTDPTLVIGGGIGEKPLIQADLTNKMINLGDAAGSMGATVTITPKGFTDTPLIVEKGSTAVDLTQWKDGSNVLAKVDNDGDATFKDVTATGDLYVTDLAKVGALYAGPTGTYGNPLFKYNWTGRGTLVLGDGPHVIPDQASGWIIMNDGHHQNGGVISGVKTLSTYSGDFRHLSISGTPMTFENVDGQAKLANLGSFAVLPEGASAPLEIKGASNAYIGFPDGTIQTTSPTGEISIVSGMATAGGTVTNIQFNAGTGVESGSFSGSPQLSYIESDTYGTHLLFSGNPISSYAHSGSDSVISIGYGAGSGSESTNSISIGQHVGTGSVVADTIMIGTSGAASEDYATISDTVAIGSNTRPGDSSTIVGKVDSLIGDRPTRQGGTSAVAVGHNALRNSKGDYSVAVGKNAASSLGISGQYTSSIGANSYLRGSYGVSVGGYASAQVVAVGSEYYTAVGYGASAGTSG